MQIETPSANKYSYLSQGSIQHMILHIQNLISPTESVRNQSALALSSLHNTPQTFQCFIQMITYFLTNPSLNSKYNENTIKLVLYYMRNILNESKYPMSQLCHYFNSICNASQNKSIVQLSYKCFAVYLNKPKNLQYKKTEIDTLIFQIYNAIKNKQQNYNLINKTIYLLSDPLMNKKSGYYFTNNNQKMIHEIITKFWNYGQGYIDENVWVRLILAFCNYTGFVPTCGFVCRYIVSEELDIKQIYTLSEMYNKMYNKITQIEQLHNILMHQIHLLPQNYLIQLQLYLGNDQGIIAILKNIHHSLSLIFKIISIKNHSHHQQMNETAGSLSCQDSDILYSLGSSQFFVSLMEIVFGVINQNMTQEVYEPIAGIVTAYSNLNPQIVTSFFQSIATVTPMSPKLLMLLTNLPNCSCIDLSQHINEICSQFEQIEKSGKFQQQNCQFLCKILQVITSFLKYKKDIVTQSLFQYLIEFLKIVITSKYIQKDRFKTLAFVLSLEMTIIRLQLMEQRKQKHEIISLLSSNIPYIVEQTYEILSSIISSEQPKEKNLNYKDENVEAILESLKLLTQLPITHSTLFNSIMSFLTTIFINQFKPGHIHIYICFLQIFQNCLHLQFIQNIQQIAIIIETCFKSKNQSLSYVACQTFLSIATVYNKQLFLSPPPTPSLLPQSPSTLKQCQLSNQFFSLIALSKILPHIEQILSEQQDDPVYTKILLQLSVHKNLLNELCCLLNSIVKNVNNSYVYGYNFDRVWQAIVLLYDFHNEYTEKKKINQKIEKIKRFNIEELFETLNISDIQQNQEWAKMRLINPKNKIKWTELSQVKRIIPQNSQISQIIEKCLLNQCTL